MIFLLPWSGRVGNCISRGMLKECQGTEVSSIGGCVQGLRRDMQDMVDDAEK